MIVSNRRHMFGVSQVGVIQNDSFRCVVSTAPEGFFKGYSILIQTFEGNWGSQRNQQVVAKAMLYPKMSRIQRAAAQAEILTQLDVLGSKGVALGNAIDEVFSEAMERNVIVDFLNPAHPLSGMDPVDSWNAAKGVELVVEESRQQIEGDAQRLFEIIQAIADQIGDAPMHYDDNGNVFVHPILANELKKPGNETLSELLRIGARSGAAAEPPSSS